MTAALAFCSEIEEPHAFPRVLPHRPTPRRNYTNYIAGWNPFQDIAGSDAIMLGNRLGNRDLEFACNLSHDPYYSKDNVLVKGTLSACGYKAPPRGGRLTKGTTFTVLTPSRPTA